MAHKNANAARGMTPAESHDVDIADMYRCGWCNVLGWNCAGSERHHRLPRGRARNLHDWHNVTLLCKRHHDRAHAEARWPWLIPGTTLRGRYSGPDPIYQWILNGEPRPDLSDLRAAFPEASDEEARWALDRALRWHNAGHVTTP